MCADDAGLHNVQHVNGLVALMFPTGTTPFREFTDELTRSSYINTFILGYIPYMYRSAHIPPREKTFELAHSRVSSR
jgi:hypothetical protein